MKKNEYDALTKVAGFLEGFRDKVAYVRDNVHVIADEVVAHVEEIVDGALAEVSKRLDESPLEDPVVPTWGGTDSVKSDDRKAKEAFIVKTVSGVDPNNKFANPDYVASLDDKTFAASYAAIKIASLLGNGKF